MYKCFKCGFTDVETKMWVKLNTNIPNGNVSELEVEDNWCCVCEEHCGIIEEDDKLNNKLNERNCD
jgi:hypothetical protein